MKLSASEILQRPAPLPGAPLFSAPRPERPRAPANSAARYCALARTHAMGRAKGREGSFDYFDARQQRGELRRGPLEPAFLGSTAMSR